MILWILFLPLLVIATPVLGPKRRTSLPLPDRLVHQFPNGTWLENVLVRSNGDLLVTALIPTAALYRVSGPSNYSPSVTLVHNFTSVQGLLGISETKPDVFVVLGGNFTSPGAQVNGTFSAWEVDMSHGSHKHSSKSPAIVKLITAIPPAAFLNGLETLPKNPTIVLISDSALGVVWRLDTLTGHFNKALNFPEMKVAWNHNATLAIGINGIRILNDILYWTNSFQQTIYRVKIDKNGSVAPGAGLEKVVNIKEAHFLDDFAVGTDGTIWACENVGNRLFAVRPDGSYKTVAGGVNQTTIAGDTAAAIGAGNHDQSTLYIVTSGALALPVNGTYTEGGKVVAIDISSY
ncbi:hypothetical protein NKR19_g8081 [Coniochaeta hoffmannii]|uniref:SMP-30/Gluconolactonase/LRE-like region domain-containing protein n=1 Tax=Coniochaeta hoffmannii TaxID=91930 RepID=A0AA38VCH9_9PEZI|nr:hypothetical protein NKR19_g8081 [Coniochaeta hoffmannii]